MNYLKWKAEFRDNTELEQFDINGKERQFIEVRDKFNKLEFFSLEGKNIFKIDLNEGNILVNNKKLDIENESVKKNIRLIYFKRHIHKIENNKEQSHEMFYFLGYQYNVDFGNNKKFMIKIDKNENYSLGEI